jgi:hypothetical protein
MKVNHQQTLKAMTNMTRLIKIRITIFVLCSLTLLKRDEQNT